MYSIEQIRNAFETVKDGDMIGYGAKKNAEYLAKCMYAMGLEKKLSYFLVSSLASNPSNIYGHKVVEFRDKEQIANKIVVIAVSDEYKAEVAIELERYGCYDYFFWNNDVMTECGKIYLIKSFNFILKDKEYYLSEDKLCKTNLTITNKRTHKSYKMLSYGNGMPYDDITRKKLIDFDFDTEAACLLGNIKYLNDFCDKNMDFDSINEPDVKIYMACNVADKKIKNESKNLERFTFPVQAGRAISNYKICEIDDALGENISDKNKLMSEMTVTYWMWKNSQTTAYKGLCHYRRRFALSEKQLAMATSRKIDVILDIPWFALPDVATNFLRDKLFSEFDLKLMLKIIENSFPQYKNTAEKQLNGCLYYPNNMFIARYEVFDEYCKFVFSVLLDMYGFFQKRCIARNDRGLSYIAEVLSSIYWAHHKDKYNIAVSEFELLE